MPDKDHATLESAALRLIEESRIELKRLRLSQKQTELDISVARKELRDAQVYLRSLSEPLDQL
jgi:hypothetical protein